MQEAWISGFSAFIIHHSSFIIHHFFWGPGMAAEKAVGIVLRTTDFSETSRIATIWTRELGKVRALAKGGRRPRSSFENALDLLTLCSMVLLRKSSGGLDLLTEARVTRRFSKLTLSLPAMYGAYYVAELLNDWTEENDPHPTLFDRAVEALHGLNAAAEKGDTAGAGLQVFRFEMSWLVELGHLPRLRECVACGTSLAEHGGADRVSFSVAAGGVVCRTCQPTQRDWQTLSGDAWRALQSLARPEGDWKEAAAGPRVGAELRRVLGHYVTYLLGRRPRLLSYLEGYRDPKKGS
jgi:DNA repair protein RecO (recombination protein O)